MTQVLYITETDLRMETILIGKKEAFGKVHHDVMMKVQKKLGIDEQQPQRNKKYT